MPLPTQPRHELGLRTLRVLLMSAFCCNPTGLSLRVGTPLGWLGIWAAAVLVVALMVAVNTHEEEAPARHR